MLKIGHLNVRAFVMVVPEMPWKTVAIQEHLRAVGIGAEEFPCICAIDPKTKQPLAGLSTLHSYEVDAPGSGYRIGPKSVALCMSFQMFWLAASYMPEEHFFFIEWDALFQPNWLERAAQAIADTPPDFDFLFLGSCCTENKPKTHVKGDIYQVRWPMCNHAQIIAKKAMGTLLRTQRKIYAPADISLAVHAFPHLKVYTLLPRCVDQSDTKIPP